MNLPQEPLDNRRRGSSPLFRYSCRHSHFSRIHDRSPGRFSRARTLPYPSLGLDRAGCPAWPSHARNAAASVSCLSPVTLSARNHLTSELLRTLSRMAASKPTSWLSGQSHILSHLARTWGP